MLELIGEPTPASDPLGMLRETLQPGPAAFGKGFRPQMGQSEPGGRHGEHGEAAIGVERDEAVAARGRGVGARVHARYPMRRDAALHGIRCAMSAQRIFRRNSLWRNMRLNCIARAHRDTPTHPIEYSGIIDIKPNVVMA